MEPIAHLLWTYLIWQNTDKIGLALFFSVFPDLVSVVPFAVYNLVVKKGKGIMSFGANSVKGWFRTYGMYSHRIVHSIVISGIVSMIVLSFDKTAFWILAWPFHVFIDIFTHKKGHIRFMWPVNDYMFNGIKWDTKWALIGNYVILIILYLIF